MSYICTGCGQAFEEPAAYVEPSTGERRRLSPCCLEAVREAVPCPVCGDPMEAEETVCPVCARRALERFRRSLEDFTPEERELLDLAYDGRSLTEEG